jgi:hypothetical protein
MTELGEIRSTVANSQTEDWVPFGNLGTWTYSDEVELRIVRGEQLDPNLEVPWTQHLQAASQSFAYHVYYDNSPVEYHEIASVDNFRAHIPLPRPPSNPNEPYTISPYQATVGRIITGDDQTFEAYLNNTGIEIRQG